jgi:hypothetical protein
MEENTINNINPSENSPQEMHELLYQSLSNRIKELKNSEDEFCIIDRQRSDSFIEVFRDGLYSYKKNCAICERLYFKSVCQDTKIPTLSAPDEAQDLYKEFIKYTSSLTDIDKMSPDEQSAAEVKLKEFRDKLSSSDMKPQVIEKDTLCYRNEFSENKEYIVVPLKDIPDANLEFLLRTISQFTIAYFLGTRLIFPTNDIVIKVFPTKYDDYIDIVAMLEVK